MKVIVTDVERKLIDSLRENMVIGQVQKLSQLLDLNIAVTDDASINLVFETILRQTKDVYELEQLSISELERCEACGGWISTDNPNGCQNHNCPDKG